MTLFDDVGDFHRKFGLPYSGDGGGPPALLDKETGAFRWKFLVEEMREYGDAVRAGDLAGAADALADLIYVALGTAHMMRLPFDDIWDEVQRANMSKERATGADDPRSARGSALDVVKPAGFRPPDHARALAMSATGGPQGTNWDRRFMALARHVARWSKDPSTKVGAVLVQEENQVALGYNGFPRGIADTAERLADRALKYRLIQHAERNVLDNAAFSAMGSTLYVTQLPCTECAKSIVSKGVRRVVSPGLEALPERWRVDGAWAVDVMAEGGVIIGECGAA
jgi:dCMP deaminase